MGAKSRRKGLVGEQEVTRILREHGFSVDRLDGEGDRLVAFDARHVLHVESKRQERVRIPEWMRQATAEAKNGRVPVVVFRQSRGEWTATLRLADLLELAHG